MQIEVGKKYRNRAGLSFEILSNDNPEPYVFLDDFGRTYTRDGFYVLSNQHHNCNLIEEHIDPDQACNTEDAVIDLIRKRGKVGRENYKCSMDRRDLHPDEWIEHHQEELADALQYAERMKGSSKLLHEALDIMLTLLHESDWECVRAWIEKYHAQFLPRENKQS